MYKRCIEMSGKYYQTVHQIISTGHSITDRIGRELKEFDITEPQFNVLRTLKGAKGQPLTVQEILDKMVQRSSNVTRIVDKLIAKGYVERCECPTNRRKMDITLTEEGATALKKFDKKIYNMYKPTMNNLSEEELDTLKNLIQKLVKQEND